ncbi:hypothetical protein HGP28_11050 [Vibrio sp. SM6]|uniref:Uncharacterized protein n=1 Tax=Vibrio agarilyticus TaxID=2726741 RepID=A0A7X8TRA2_9VIBR|nr:hypothetical protein [Vibrio agarilyticus]NLS13430.1 hypothetical protein [Vibrio agarilyticus]
MLLDLVNQSIQEFQTDCSQLCEKHYPTVHNQGISGHHLALAYARRLKTTLEKFEYQSQVEPLDTLGNAAHPEHYRVSSPIGTVWVITHHVVSAGRACRDKLIQAINEWQTEYAFAIQPNDLLLLISDHWIGRSRASRELLYWWMGELPSPLGSYQAQGISLYPCETPLSQRLEERFAITPCLLKYAHPLKRSGGEEAVKKYLHLYAVLQW